MREARATACVLQRAQRSRATDGELHDEGTGMASNGKKKTTMAKLNRESKLRERRVDKQARKDARKQAAADELNGVSVPQDAETDDMAQPDTEQPDLEAVAVNSADR